MLLELAILLRAACPDDLKVTIAVFDVALSESTVLRPDILVGRRDAYTDRDLPAAPMLAVEISSPSTWLIDLMLKRARFEAAGCGSYWVVDPAAPSIIAWDLTEDRYVQVGSAEGDQSLEAVLPFALTVRPGDLVRKR